MENQIEHNQNNEEEISLIDLFAVLLRYRKLIVIGTLVTTFLAGVYLFVLPMVVPHFDKKESVVSYNIVVNKLPNVVERQLPNVVGGSNLISGLAVASIQDLPFFASVYKNHMIFSIDEKQPQSEVNYNTMVQKLLVDDKKVVVKNSVFGTGVEISLQVPEVNMDKVETFVSDLVVTTNKRIAEYMLPQLENLRKTTMETIASLERQTSMMGNSTQDLQDILMNLEEYMASLKDFVWLEGSPFVVSVAQGRMTKLIIAAFAALFVTVFTAFVLNAINNVKADPQASKVISEAWKAGK